MSGSRTASSSSACSACSAPSPCWHCSTADQAGGPHPPERDVDPILAEEGLVLENQGGHTPMAGGLECCLVRRHLGVEGLGIGHDLRVQLCKIQPGPCCG